MSKLQTKHLEIPLGTIDEEGNRKFIFPKAFRKVLITGNG
jgi:hypothetical protein